MTVKIVFLPCLQSDLDGNNKRESVVILRRPKERAVANS